MPNSNDFDALCSDIGYAVEREGVKTVVAALIKVASDQAKLAETARERSRWHREIQVLTVALASLD